jgi:predicted glycosyltransferase
MRFLFYSHDGLGLGHTRRHLAIAAALTRVAPDSSVLLASGADDALRMGLPARVEILKLPGLRKVSNDHYCSRRLHIPTSEIRALRSALLLTTVKSYRPDVVLVDKHPFGANGEFRDALSWVRDAGSRTVLGLRDILDAPAAVLKEWSPHDLQQEIDRNFDLMLIYGERAIFDPLLEYRFPSSMEQRSRFCGYVINRDEHDPSPGSNGEGFDLSKWPRPIVLATTGGGEDGFQLLETFVRVAAEAPWQGILVAGPMTPAHELKKLERLAQAHNVPMHRFVPNLSVLFWSVDTVVCMGGYNTLAEAVAKGVPVISVPRTRPRAEQLMRAQAFERLGLVRTLSADKLNVVTLREATDGALALSRKELLARTRAALSFDGAEHAAGHLLALARDQRRPTDRPRPPTFVR